MKHSVDSNHRYVSWIKLSNGFKQDFRLEEEEESFGYKQLQEQQRRILIGIVQLMNFK